MLATITYIIATIYVGQPIQDDFHDMQCNFQAINQGTYIVTY
jgi:hypothetical protein